MFLNFVMLFSNSLTVDCVTLVGFTPGSWMTLETGEEVTLVVGKRLVMWAAKSSKSNTSPSASMRTGRGVAYFFLKLVVAGQRKTRAASAVTLMSMRSFSCSHRRFKAVAMGFHRLTSMFCVHGQYTCKPPPEPTM